MLRIQSDDERLVRLERMSLEPAETPPAGELRDLVLANADAVVADVDTNLFLLDSGLSGGNGEAPQVDLLCVHPDGAITVLVLPLSSDQQLATALTIAANVAEWTPEVLVNRLPDERRSRLAEFLGGAVDQLNHRQRVVLMTRDENPALVATSKWLQANGVDISVCRMAAHEDPRTHETYLTLPSSETPRDGPFIVRETLSTGALLAQTDLDRELAALTGRLEKEERGRYLLEQRYRTVSRLAPIGIFHTDPGGEYLFVNPRWCEITGLTPQEASGKGWTRALHPDDRGRVLTAWKDAILSQKPFKAEIRFLRSDGTSWVIAEADVQLDSSGAMVGTAGTLTEIHHAQLDEKNGATDNSSSRVRSHDYAVR